ncbi:hypothetical protein [Neoroseomonas soli]|uniref:Uncharacterized protein n=1 Tax=Neoroseomonas soli TaxID=1081025 RepID=A0A9X9WW29_9PROT|nr:hypothetical protein [Neoroseomonas soli]MBR0671358.1 hypothetical protein [Neoroseomonas soli]
MAGTRRTAARNCRRPHTLIEKVIVCLPDRPGATPRIGLIGDRMARFEPAT